MASDSTTSQTTLDVARRLGVMRLRDAREHGIHPETIRRLVAAGQLTKVGRGMYALAEDNSTEHVDLARASVRVPHGIVCLLSALSYHGIGTQLPHEVWMMIDRRAHRPQVDHPPMRFVLGSGASLTEGIDEVAIDGRDVRIFNPAKTVVDCFRYRRHVGLEVALEALRETLRARRSSPAEIGRYAKNCRVASVIRPYLEAMS